MDRDAFDALMAAVDPTMAIITTVAAGETSGCLIGFHAQCGIEPLRYALWISKANHTYRVGAVAETWAVHFVPRDRRDLAELFGTVSGDDVDKLARCDWEPGPDGVPLLRGCPERFVGRRRTWTDVDADHVCLVVEPVDATGPGDAGWLHLSDVDDLEAGHGAEERQLEA